VGEKNGEYYRSDMATALLFPPAVGHLFLGKTRKEGKLRYAYEEGGRTEREAGRTEGKKGGKGTSAGTERIRPLRASWHLSRQSS